MTYIVDEKMLHKVGLLFVNNLQTSYDHYNGRGALSQSDHDIYVSIL